MSGETQAPSWGCSLPPPRRFPKLPFGHRSALFNPSPITQGGGRNGCPTYPRLAQFHLPKSCWLPGGPPLAFAACACPTPAVFQAGGAEEEGSPIWVGLFGPLGGGNGSPLQCSCLENPMDGGAWWAAVHGVTESWTCLGNFTFTFMHWRRKWQPTPVLLPGDSQGRGSLVGCRLWGRTESDATKAT